MFGSGTITENATRLYRKHQSTLVTPWIKPTELPQKEERERGKDIKVEEKTRSEEKVQLQEGDKNGLLRCVVCSRFAYCLWKCGRCGLGRGSASLWGEL